MGANFFQPILMYPNCAMGKLITYVLVSDIDKQLRECWSYGKPFLITELTILFDIAEQGSQRLDEGIATHEHARLHIFADSNVPSLFDKSAISANSSRCRLAELRQQPIRRQKFGRFHLSCCSAVAAPSPIASTAHHIGTNRIEYDIASQLKQVALLLDYDRLEAAPHKMTKPRMLSVEPLGIDTIEMPHASGKIGLRRLNKEMVVIGHQAVGVADPAETVDCGSKDLQKTQPISVVKKDLSTGISSAGNMIHSAFIFNP